MDGAVSDGGEPGRHRRTFLEGHELPGLLRGVYGGEARAIRRLLGARRSGRIGTLAVLLCGLAACPAPGAFALAALLHVAVAEVARRTLPAPLLGLRQWLRLAHWTIPLPLLVAAIAHAVFSTPALAGACAALGVGHAVVWRGLRGGL